MNRKNVTFLLLGLSAALLIDNVSSEALKGGVDANIIDFPYQVALKQDNGDFICGGSIIGSEHVITAAHCVTDEKTGQFNNKGLKIVAGTDNLNTQFMQFPRTTRVEIAVEKIYVPMEYFPIKYKNVIGDIAVLKNHWTSISNLKIAKINLPIDRRADYSNVNALVSGFGVNDLQTRRDPIKGLVEYNFFNTYKMRYAYTYVISNEECNKYFSYDNPVSSSHVCAIVYQRSSNYHEGVCRGDSGGPLAYGNTLIGSVSTSPVGCGEHQGPSVYTRVSSYLDFIRIAVKDQADARIRTKVL